MHKMRIAGIRFRLHGKVYDFDSGQLELSPGERVVVETARGQELGEVVVLREGEAEASLKPVLRVALVGDIQKATELKAKERLALEECAGLIAQLGLPMKLISAEYSLDETHLTVYFGAEGRVDFRELVRELGHKLHVRVELRQIGPRDEAKILGGYGRCGRELCCSQFLSDFSPVSIKMAKIQDLPLNPMKISGVCGRLLCCLGYECEQYREIKEKMPREGTWVMTDSGSGVIVGHNALGEKVMVEFETGARLEIPLDRVRVMEAPRGRRVSQALSNSESQPNPKTPANHQPEAENMPISDEAVPPDTEPRAS